MLYRNKRLAEALTFVRDSGADIFCLQEVPEQSLEQFTALYPYHAEAIEMVRLFPGNPLNTYGVILSRYPIRTIGTIPLDDYQDRLPWRTRLLIVVLYPFYRWTRIRDRNALYADIETPNGLVRIINIHLSLSHPTWRLEEFEAAMMHRDPSLPTIVCGDFNILERPHIAPLNWLAGGRISDAFFHKRERTVIEQHFVKYELTNAHRGRRTQTLSRSQLDHILVSHDFTITNAHVTPLRYGSDHHPISVEIAS